MARFITARIPNASILNIRETTVGEDGCNWLNTLSPTDYQALTKTSLNLKTAGGSSNDHHNPSGKTNLKKPSLIRVKNNNGLNFFFPQLPCIASKMLWRPLCSAFNPFHATGLFQYPMKTSVKFRFSDVFRGYRKRPVTWKGFKKKNKVRQGILIKVKPFYWGLGMNKMITRKKHERNPITLQSNTIGNWSPLSTWATLF